MNQQGNIGGGKHLEVPDLSLQHVCCYFDNDDDVIVVVVVVVVVAGGWTMLDNCCLHSHFTFAILFQALVSESTTSAVSIYNDMFGFCSCHEYSFGKISLFCSFLSIYYHRQQDTVTASAATATRWQQYLQDATEPWQ